MKVIVALPMGPMVRGVIVSTCAMVKTLLAAATLWLVLPAYAQTWPAKPIHLVSIFVAGSAGEPVYRRFRELEQERQTCLHYSWA